MVKSEEEIQARLSELTAMNNRDEHQRLDAVIMNMKWVIEDD
jgi:hypothetical protein